MEGIMVSAATGVMNSLLTKLTTLLGEEYKLQKEVKRDVAFLKDELSSMNALLEKLANTEVLDPQQKEWRNQVREMAYDIEDCIDDYMHRLHQGSNKSKGIKRFFSGAIKEVKKLEPCHEIVEQMRELNTRVVEVKERHDRYRLDAVLDSGSTDVVPSDPRLRALYAEAFSLVGTDVPRDELIKMVDDGEKSLKVVSVVGSGGLGKTTLANQVYQKVGEQFGCRAFVSVSQKPDTRKILRRILSQIRKQEYEQTESGDEQCLINAVRDCLQDERYFIVIDDIWSTQAWNIIKRALLENTCGSRILVTTRITTVAKSCCSPRHDLVYELRPLSEGDSKSLFFRRVFGSEDNCPLQLKEVSTEIIRKCGGLPLAIITMSSLLTTKSDAREEWLMVLNSIGLGLEKNSDVEEIKKILSLSYNGLPLHLRTCLLYLSMFREDYEIWRDRLVSRWIAEGFVKVDGGRNLMDEGECYFNELINRSMIQPVQIAYDGRVNSCRVHDMILGLIISKAGEENFITSVDDQTHSLEFQSKIRRLSLDYRGQENVIVMSSMVTPHVRSLGIFGYSVQMPSFSDLHALRVLDIQTTGMLENCNLINIGKLFLLRYLRIEANSITNLPEQIGELQYLETLDLSSTHIRELPASIVNLRRLKRLHGSSALKLPDGVGNMQDLEELERVCVNDESSINSLQELGNLTKLRTLQLVWCIGGSHRDTYAGILASSLGKLRSSNLRCLNVYGDGIGSMDSWSSPTHLLRQLAVQVFYLKGIPEWMASLANLTLLDIKVKKVTQETFQILVDLPALLKLDLQAYATGRLVVCNGGFQRLKYFYLWASIMGPMFEAGAAPKLEELKFRTVFLEVQSACGLGIHHLSALRALDVEIDSRGARVKEVEAWKASIKNEANLLPNRPTPFFWRWKKEDVQSGKLMEGIMVSAATGVMNSLLTKLTTLLGERYKLQKKVKRDAAFLKDELSSMNALLETLADTEVLDPQRKYWRNQVREMSYDIEDCIDDYMHRLHQDADKSNGNKGFFSEMIKKLKKVKKLGARHEIGKQLRELKTRIVEASQRRDRYKLDAVLDSGSSAIDPRLRALYAEASSLIGIDVPRDELIKLVDDGEKSLKVVSVVGFGGLGKTTLANQVYEKVGEQFDCRAFVSVSQKPDTRKILRTILSQIRKQEYEGTESGDEECLINAIKDFLKDKRYFIVIDDIWSTQAWNIIKRALLENTCGSRILVTTRIATVAKSCCSPRHDLVYELRPLSEGDSKSLFFRRVFGSEECPLQLREVSTEIIRKCGGLPLAIITMSSLLTTKSDAREEWLMVLNSIGLGLEKNSDVEEMKKILSLSYNDLPHHLRTCLLYLSMFPEDYSIQRDRLVSRWIAEGFVKVDGGRNLMEEGECYFNELINRNMIQTVDINNDGRVHACRVPDMILDLIISKAVEENFITSVGDQSKIRRLSLDYRGQENVIEMSSKVTAHLRSLHIFGCSVQMPSISDLHALRVLDIETTGMLENSCYLRNIGKLFQLRYLRIEAHSMKNLPEQICELQYLETLDISSAGIRGELPASIVKLRRLKQLLCGRVKLPDWVGNMQALEVLSRVFVNDKSSINSLQELGNLTELRTLHLDWWCTGDSHRDTYEDILASSLGKLCSSNLTCLRVVSDPWETWEIGGPRLDSWSLPSDFLRELDVGDCYLKVIPGWMASLANLTFLSIRVNQVTEETFQILGNLSVLLSLVLQPHPPEERLVVWNVRFQRLKYLHFNMGPVFEAGAVPKLEELKFRIVVREVQSARGLGIHHVSALRKLTVCIETRGSAGVEEVEAWKASIKNEASLLPHHPTPSFILLSGEEVNEEDTKQQEEVPTQSLEAQPSSASTSAASN